MQVKPRSSEVACAPVPQCVLESRSRTPYGSPGLRERCTAEADWCRRCSWLSTLDGLKEKP